MCVWPLGGGKGEGQVSKFQADTKTAQKSRAWESQALTVIQDVLALGEGDPRWHLCPWAPAEGTSTCPRGRSHSLGLRVFPRHTW